MRARLLDMGEVSALRSQSLYHAMASKMAPAGDPVLVVVRAASAFVSIGDSGEGAEEVDLESCRERRIPVIRRHGAGAPEPLDGNRLLFQLLIPAARAAEALPPDARQGLVDRVAEGVVEALGQLGIEARLPAGGAIEADGRSIGHFEAVEIGQAACFSGSLALDFDPAFAAGVLRHPKASTAAERAEALSRTHTAIWAELDEPPVWATVAEALLDALEARLGLELTPSMPTLEELEAVYEWDGRLPARELLDAPREAGALSS